VKRDQIEKIKMPRLFTALATLFFTSTAMAEDKAGDFDYYVLSLSWSPTWCAIEGDGRGSPQCDASEDFGWILHGLWPQYHQGWPSFCNTRFSPPSRGQTGDMADIMGTSGLAWHQWRKHGACSGLSPSDYYALSREAYEQVNRPEVFRKLDRSVTLPASVVEEAFLKANPTWEPDMLTITCKQNRVQEARLCLSRDLTPVPCGRDVIRDCQMTNALFDPIR
jgi:ribonuclease T2